MNRGRILPGRILAAATALAMPAASLAAAPAGPPLARCIDRDARWTALDDHRILASTTHGEVLAIAGACPRLNAPLTHIVVSRAQGTPICGPHDVRLYVADASGIRTPCLLRSLRPVSPGEARALRAGRR